MCIVIPVYVYKGKSFFLKAIAPTT